MKCEFIIPGPPMGKGRPRVTKQGHAFTPEKTVVYENLVKVEYQRQCGERFPDEAQLNVQILAYYAIPKSVSKKKRQAMLNHIIRPKKKPDGDNIIKIVCDSLNDIAYHDDAQVVDFVCRKFYSAFPRVEVTIEGAAPEY